MTAPVDTDDVVQGAAKVLLSHPEVVALLGVNPDGSPYLFQYRLGAPELEGSSQTAVVVSSDGGWTTPNVHNTLRFPRLVVQVFADPMRDATGNTKNFPEVQRRVDVVFATVDRVLHRPQSGIQMWGSVRTLSCARLSDPVTYSVPDGDQLLRSTFTYAVTVG